MLNDGERIEDETLIPDPISVQHQKSMKDYVLITSMSTLLRAGHLTRRNDTWCHLPPTTLRTNNRSLSHA